MVQEPFTVPAPDPSPEETTAELERLRTALSEADGVIAKLRSAAQAASQAKADFMARMTHEMRTPLSAIISLAKLALADENDPKLINYLGKIQISASTLLDIVDDITDFSRLEKGLADVVPVPCDLPSILTRVIERFAEGARQKGLRLRAEQDPNAPTRLMADHVRLEQILGHLVGNAVKFTEKGAVTLTVRVLMREGNTVRLEFAVRDTGIGMASETIPDMLESFTQADGSLSRPYGGTGLGLAIVQRGVSLLGGELHAESTLGSGTLFSFSIEATVDAAEGLPVPESAPLLPLASSNPAKAPLAGARLLLVEDNSINQQVARDILERFGARVTVASHGGEAVEMVQTAPFDLVLMDVQMPVMDGLAATRRIRELPHVAKLPIVALTAHALAEDRERCLAAGMNDYLTKPIDPEQLLSTLGQWIAQAAIPTAPAAPTASTAPRAAAPPLPADEALNTTTALARLGGNIQLFHNVLAEFARDYAGCAQTLRQDTAAGDLDAARRLAHTIKGVAGNIAADPLAEAARDLETTLGRGERPDEAALAAFTTALRQTLEAASRLTKPKEAAPTRPLAPAPAWHILLVDDARLNRAIFSQILASAGHHVTVADNGKEACRLLFGEKACAPFDCILMDIEMPEMDGVQAASLIRKLLAASANPPCARDIPIVALTSHDPTVENDRCCKAGMNACLGKAFDWQELLNALDQMLTDHRQTTRTVAKPSKKASARALTSVLRRLAEHLHDGSIQADEDLAVLEELAPQGPALEALTGLTQAIHRYDFATALQCLPAVATALGLDPEVVIPVHKTE